MAEIHTAVIPVDEFELILTDESDVFVQLKYYVHSDRRIEIQLWPKTFRDHMRMPEEGRELFPQASEANWEQLYGLGEENLQWMREKMQTCGVSERLIYKTLDWARMMTKNLKT